MSFSFVDAGAFKHSRKVLNVVPGDFTHSGKLDLLVMDQSQTSNQIDLTLYPALASGGFGIYDSPFRRSKFMLNINSDINNPFTLPPSELPQPIPIDVDGDMKIDLLGITPSSEGSADSIYRIWQNVWNASATDPTLFKTLHLLYLYPFEPANKPLARMPRSMEDNVSSVIHTAMLLWTSTATVWQVLPQTSSLSFYSNAIYRRFPRV